MNVKSLQQSVEDLELRIVREMHLTSDAQKLAIGAFKTLRESLDSVEKIVLEALQGRNDALASTLGKGLVEPETIENTVKPKRPAVSVVASAE